MTSAINFWNEKWVRIAFDGIETPPHYEVSNYGRIRSYQGNNDGTIIKGSVIQGYRSLNLRLAGKKTINYYVHKLVAEYFVPQPSELHKYVIHLDYEKQNNRHQNLRWVTREEMRVHNRENPAILNRVMPRRTVNYKVTEAQVKVMKKMVKSEKSRYKTIAKQFGITPTQLSRIRAGENWANVRIEEEA